MTVLQAMVLGVVQGITEFIPVSSSGHLIFFPKLLGWIDQGLAFDVVVHMGTLLAVIIFFRIHIFSILRGFVSKDTHSRTIFFMLAISIIPASAAGILFGGAVEQKLRSPLVVASGLIVWGIVLGLADWYGRRQRNKKTLETIQWKQVLAMSFAQAIALIPGTSRSGITMTAGMFSSLEKTAAAEFSFLMSIPIIGLAGIIKMVELFESPGTHVAIGALSIGFISSAASGFFAIYIFMKLIQKWSLLPFVVYRIALGMAILLFLK